MINMLLGLPGGGKSYEAVVFHILPALAQGRKVITNLPLNVENICALFPDYRPLIELRSATLKERPQAETATPYHPGFPAREVRHNPAAFANLEDYGDPWRHPVSGAGPLYVIDECHICLPKIGTPVKVEEWFSMHRHEFADVLLITQTYGKINQAIREIVQVCYRVKKATAFGFNSKYIRKVQDGIRGEVVNTSIREYKKENYKFYNSHTKSGAGSEQASQDIRPIWKNWTFIGAGVCLLFVVGMFSFADMKNPLNANSHTEKVNGAKPARVPGPLAVSPSPDRVSARLPADDHTPTKPPTQAQQEPPQSTSVIDDPYEKKGLHLVGVMETTRDGKKHRRWMFAVSQNGQFITTISDSDLAGSGYQWQAHSECSGVLVLGKVRRAISCDSPQIQLVPTSVNDKA